MLKVKLALKSRTVTRWLRIKKRQILRLTVKKCLMKIPQSPSPINKNRMQKILTPRNQPRLQTRERMKAKEMKRVETIRVITRVNKNVRITHPQIEVEGEEEMTGEETFKIEEGEMMDHHRDEGVMTILNHEEEEGDKVGILRTEEDQTALLREEVDTTMTIVGIEIMVITEVIGSAEKDPIDLLAETTTGEVIEVEIEVVALAEMIAVTIVVMTVVMIVAVTEDLVVLAAADVDGDGRLIF